MKLNCYFIIKLLKKYYKIRMEENDSQVFCDIGDENLNVYVETDTVVQTKGNLLLSCVANT